MFNGCHEIIISLVSSLSSSLSPLLCRFEPNRRQHLLGRYFMDEDAKVPPKSEKAKMMAAQLGKLLDVEEDLRWSRLEEVSIRTR